MNDSQQVNVPRTVKGKQGSVKKFNDGIFPLVLGGFYFCKVFCTTIYSVLAGATTKRNKNKLD